MLNVPTTIGTFGLGIWAVHVVYMYANEPGIETCNLPFIITLFMADMIIGLIIASVFSLFISYGIASTRMHKLNFIVVILVNILRVAYSTLSLGLNIAITVYNYRDDCVSI